MPFRGGSVAWRGDPALQAEALRQLEAHHQAAALLPLELGGQRLEFYGWGQQPSRLDLVAQALGLPEDLLRLGWYLLQDFPESQASIRAEIGLKRQILEAIPPGADATGVAPAFTAWRLGRIVGQAAPEDQARVQDVADAIELWLPDELDRLRPEVERVAERTGEQLPAQWQSQRRVDSAVYRSLRVLEAARAACDVFARPEAARESAEASVFGAHGVDVEDSPGDSRAMDARFLELLAQLGGRGPPSQPLRTK